MLQPFCSLASRRVPESHDSTLTIVPLTVKLSASSGYLPNGVVGLFRVTAAIPVPICAAAVVVPDLQSSDVSTLYQRIAPHLFSNKDPLMRRHSVPFVAVVCMTTVRSGRPSSPLRQMVFMRMKCVAKNIIGNLYYFNNLASVVCRYW